MSEPDILNSLQSSKDGLAETEAKRRLQRYGPNEIVEEKPTHASKIFLRQFSSPLVIILLVATLVSFAIGETIDAFIILAIVILSAVVGFTQEYRSEKAIETLRKMAANTVSVVRDGAEKVVNTKDLVPGDVILVSVGDRIPADAYILEEFNLETNEASLSGESTSVKKASCILPTDTPLSDRKNILYMITTVTRGRAKAVVFSTAMKTELGKVATTIQTIETGKSPFEKRVEKIGKTLGIIMLIVVGIISLVGLFRGFEIFDMFVWGTSLAVAAVPEALPAVVVASLTAGIYKMSKQNAVMKKMSAVETLGATTVICSDKTGTLTKGEQMVKKILLGKTICDVSGTGYELDGNITGDGLDKGDLSWFAKCAVLCNDANIRVENKKPEPTGDPTEAALIVLGKKAGISKNYSETRWPRIHEIQFSSERKLMTTVNKIGDRRYAFVKGATEVVLDKSKFLQVHENQLPLDDSVKESVMNVMDSFASKGLRVLALAYREVEEGMSNQEIESKLVFLGLAAMIDPPRKEAIDAVALCKNAGIQVKMVTGDHKLTAESIAEELGILDSETQSLTGEDLDKMTNDDLVKIVENVSVFSRVTSEHKMKLVKSLRELGHVVAMTGDGINDAAALKGADIGIAMGVTGTQVTKEASSMILLDDNFASIVSAVKQGRRIMDNVKKFLVYLLPVNIGEIIFFGYTIAAGFPIPLLAKHILYINLVTDGAPAIALGMDTEESDLMKRKPMRPNESVFKGTFGWFIGVSIIIGLVSVLLFWYVLDANGWNDELAKDKARTVVFGFLVFEEIFFALSCRSLRVNLHKVGIFGNRFLIYSLIGEFVLTLFIMNFPPTVDLFDLAYLGPGEWFLILILSPVAFLYSEILKWSKGRLRLID